jgi:hypothetical protein
MTHLTETHKECLKALVKMVREGTIPAEFQVLYYGAREGPVLVGKDGQHTYGVTGLSRLGLEALTRAELLFSLPSYQCHASSFSTSTTETESERGRSCYITPDGFRAVDSGFAPFNDLVMHRAPVELTSSLAHFKRDFPDSSRLAFVMMRFGKSNAHATILQGIRSALDPQQLVALRADDKQYHDDVLQNILTYIYGCRFGIAAFERIEGDDFNPNISFEVGYMTGLGKSVCLLKDRTLRTLHTDLIGRLYCEFDTQDCTTTIAPVLQKWMSD